MANRNNRKHNKTKNIDAQTGQPQPSMTLEAFAALVSGGIHRIQPVAKEPETAISQWAMVLVTDAHGHKTRHLVGSANGEGRVTSPIKAIDTSTRTATSESGRLYRLLGDSGSDSDARYVFANWLRLTQTRVVRDVTPALERLLRARQGPHPRTHLNTQQFHG